MINDFLERYGWKSIASGLALAAVGFAYYMGWIDETMRDSLTGLFTGTAVLGLRAAQAKGPKP